MKLPTNNSLIRKKVNTSDYSLICLNYGAHKQMHSYSTLSKISAKEF